MFRGPTLRAGYSTRAALGVLEALLRARESARRERKSWTPLPKRVRRADTPVRQKRMVLMTGRTIHAGKASQYRRLSTRTMGEDLIEFSKMWYQVFETGGTTLIGTLPPLAHSR